MSRAWDPASGASASQPPSSNGAETEDWSQSGNFNKPVYGWLYPDEKIADNGICYGVRYIGCLEVNTSMKSLDFETRSQIAKECINKLCETGGLKTVDKKRKVDKRILKMVAEKPNMDYAGSNVSFTISSSYLNIVSMETGQVIAYHEMPKISFASGGDADTLDFVSYVAKDHRYGRACFVLECGGGLAQDVITTIGQAFELRYKQFLKRVPSARSEAEMLQASIHNGNIVPSRDDPEYYNDLPGKVPPDVIANATFLDKTSVKSISQSSLSTKDANANLKILPMPLTTPVTLHNETESLIDLSPSPTTVSVYRKPMPEYVNTTAVISNELLLESSTKHKTVKPDIFDMQPFSASLTSLQTEETTAGSCSSLPTAVATNSDTIFNWPLQNTDSEKMSLMEEPWFHGPISRLESERLVVKDGDFLVRESLSTPGQYVLTGMQKSSKKHLLLVDPEGVIRTKDQVFESVSHLIRYHRDNALPIVSAESALLLRNPVCRIRTTGKSIQV